MEDSGLDHQFQRPLSLAMAIQRDLGELDIYPFRYIQFRVATTTHQRFGKVIPCTYRLVAGRLPYPELTNEELIKGCQKGLSELDPERILSNHRLLDHGEGRLQRIVRKICTEVYPVLFQVLTIQHGEGHRIWNLNKFEAMEQLPEDTELGRKIQQFYSAVARYYPNETNVDDALAIITYGIEFLNIAKQWWEHFKGGAFNERDRIHKRL